MRHAAAWHEGTETTAVAGRLVELVKATGGDPSAVAVYHVGTDESRATARLVRQALGSAKPVKATLASLSPDNLSAYAADVDEVRDAWDEAARTIGDTARCVIVGHDPQLSWLLHDLGGDRVRWHTLDRGELALLEPTSDGGRRVRYVISPGDDKTSELLRGKINSKMDTAKVLGTFLTALLTFAATQLLGRSELGDWATALAFGGLVLLGAATALYFVTLFRYDELLMPSRFWPSGTPGATSPSDDDQVLRPPGSEAWVLYQNMLRVWDQAFVPATWLAGAGVAALAVAFTDPTGWWWLAPVPIVAAVVAFVVVMGRRARPHLGVND